MELNYLQSKIQNPRIQPDIVPRPHLIEQIEKGLWRKFTLICAPPGFGKSTLIAEWSLKAKNPICWFQVDVQDNLLDNFLIYLCNSIAQIQPGFGEELTRMINLTPRPSSDFYANAFLKELERLPFKVCIVLEDYHHINNLEIHQFTRNILEYLPKNIHIIISTREDPPFSLSRYRAKNEITEIRTGDLRFNLFETQSLLKVVSLTNLSTENLEVLFKRTEGWAAGIQLAGLSLLESSDINKSIHDFAGSNRYILDYLVEDVLNQQPLEVRNFLLKTSILDRFSADICNKITNDENSRKLLTIIETTNLFLIPLDDNRVWYRYHNLFSDLLRYRLKQEISPLELTTLHDTAAKWFETNQLWSEAVHHYYQAEKTDDCTRVATILASKLLEKGNAAKAIDWMDALPDGILFGSLGLLTIYCFSLVTASKGTLLIKFIPQLEKLIIDLREILPNETFDELYATLDVIKAMYYSTIGDNDQAIQKFEASFVYLKLNDPLKIGSLIGKAVAYQSLGEIVKAELIFSEAVSLSRKNSVTMMEISSMANQAGMQIKMGQLHKAEKLLLQSLEISHTEKNNRNPIIAESYLELAGIYFSWNQLTESRKYHSESYDWLIKWGNLDTMMAYLYQGFRLSMLDEVEDSRDYVQKAIELSEIGHLNPGTQLIAKMIRLDASALEKDLHSITHQVQEMFQLPENLKDSAYTELLLSAIEASISFQLSSLDELLILLEKIINITKTNIRINECIRAELLKTIGMMRLGSNETALKSLSNAIDLAYKEHNIIWFLLYGNTIKGLLSTLKTKYSGEGQEEFIEQIICNSSLIANQSTGKEFAQALKARSGKELSDREIEVLTLLASGLSTGAIAERLVLSPGTIKRHLHNIFEKLNVTSRIEAIRLAHDLGII
jgi:LuxR family transcriptional regulator, maltose regulon positive regulatory protein